MNKYLIIDTREKQHAIQTILKTFDDEGINYTSSKLLFGDYADYNKPSLVIDRKQNIAELAKNCTIESDRFRAELERAHAAGAELVILVEQNRFKDRGRWINVKSISDLILWSGQHTTITGEKVFRVLASWVSKYNVRVEFCDKRSTGKKILSILYNEQ